MNNMNNMNNTKIYCLCDESNQPRYIGKTNQTLQERLWDHLKPGRLIPITYKNNWLNSMLRKGFKPTIVLIGEFESNGNLEEVAYIKYFKDEGYKITNGTTGGEGGKPNEQALIKLRIASKGNMRFLNHNHSKATKEKCSLVAKKYWDTYHLLHNNINATTPH